MRTTQRKLYVIKTIMIAIVLTLSMSGCSMIFKKMVGAENMRAMELAGNCKLEHALEVVRREKRVGEPKYAGWAAKLEAAFLMEMGREQEAVALYDSILEMPQSRSEGLTREELDKATRQAASESTCSKGR